MRNFVFRTDASLSIGTGHVFRCLTLARSIYAEGGICHFICREHQGNLIDEIVKSGHTVHTLQRKNETQDIHKDAPNHANWLGSDLNSDAEETAEILEKIRPQWLIVDHYAINIEWEKRQRIYCQNIMIIDDLADREHDCDLLLDQNLGRSSDEYTNLAPEHCRVIAGPQFSLLRPEFSMLREYSIRRRGSLQINQILITMGGIDKNNATCQILNSLKSSSLPTNCRITVTMGEAAPYLNDVLLLAETMPWPTDVRVGARNMAQLMADSDLSIGAAGATSWERCCIGLPTLLLILADNQYNAAHALECWGAARVLSLDKNFPACLAQEIEILIRHPNQVRQMIDRSLSVTDGQGTKRVILAMNSIKPTERKAHE